MSKKDWGQWRLQIGVILQPLHLYGQKTYCSVAQELIGEVTEQLVDRLEGKDVPILVDKRKIKY